MREALRDLTKVSPKKASESSARGGKIRLREEIGKKKGREEKKQEALTGTGSCYHPQEGSSASRLQRRTSAETPTRDQRNSFQNTANKRVSVLNQGGISGTPLSEIGGNKRE